MPTSSARPSYSVILRHCGGSHDDAFPRRGLTLPGTKGFCLGNKAPPSQMLASVQVHSHSACRRLRSDTANQAPTASPRRPPHQRTSPTLNTSIPADRKNSMSAIRTSPEPPDALVEVSGRTIRHTPYVFSEASKTLLLRRVPSRESPVAIGSAMK